MKEWETTRIYIYEYMYNREQMYYYDLLNKYFVLILETFTL